MTEFNRTHAALFDELDRQGINGVDIGKLTRAVLIAKDIISSRAVDAHPRCASGNCDE